MSYNTLFHVAFAHGASCMGPWLNIRRYRVGVEALLGVTEISKGNPTIISGLLTSNNVVNTLFHVALAHGCVMHGALVEIRRYRVEALLGVTKISKGQPQHHIWTPYIKLCRRTPIFMLHWRRVRHAWGLG